MLQQMLSDDKTEEVRESVVRSLGLLMGFIDDPDKFPQVSNIQTSDQGVKTPWSGLIKYRLIVFVLPFYNTLEHQNFITSR